MVAWVAQFVCLLGFDACFPFAPFYMRELGLTDPDSLKLWTGAIMSLSTVAMAIVSPIWGMVADRRGPWLMVVRSAFGGAITLVAMALAANATQFFIIRVIQAALTGFNLAFVMFVSANAPPSRLAFSLGVMQMGGYLGYSVGPVIGGLVADRFGYRLLYAGAAILLVCGGGLIFSLSPRSSAGPGSVTNRTAIRSGLDAIGRSRSLWTVLAAIAAIYAATSLAQPVLPLFIESLTNKPSALNTSTGTVYGVVSLASAISALMIGRLGDTVSYRGILILGTSGLAMIYLGHALTSSWIALLAVTFGRGLLVGGLIPTMNTVVGQIAPRNQQSTVYGLGYTLSAGGRMIAPTLGGAIAAAWGTRSAFIAAAVLFGLVAAWLSLTPDSSRTTIDPND